MNTTTESTARALYDAFAARDGATMASLYAPDASFSDPVFPSLNGEGAGAMWRMLTGRSTDLSVVVDSLETTGDTALVAWTARYSFGPARRPVTNRVRTELVVRDGRIIRQHDAFDFTGWAAQAFGLAGRLLGWTGFFRAKVQGTAAESLAKFQAKAKEA